MPCCGYVDLIDSTFGAEEGKRHGYPGHEIIEMALMKLYELTGEEKHRRLAKYFIDQRGQAPLYFAQEVSDKPFHWKNTSYEYQYYQAGRPVREQKEAQGHAVRAVYLYSGMADVARSTEDEGLWEALEGLWNNMTKRRMYITGAIGSSHVGEAFTYDYDLPNDTVYGETCASVGLVFLAKRMLSIEPKGAYGDVMERALYNGVISGMNLAGDRFFYVNPLEVLPEASRKDEGKRHVKPNRQKMVPLCLLSAESGPAPVFFGRLYLRGSGTDAVCPSVHGKSSGGRSAGPKRPPAGADAVSLGRRDSYPGRDL